MLRPIVDRDQELNILKASLESRGEPPASILLVEDVSGQGKTKLLELYKTYCRNTQIPVAHVDLKNGSLNPLDILHAVRKELQPLLLPRCTAALQSPYIVSPSLEISDNKSLFGPASYTMETSISISGLSSEERKQWWSNGARALLDDLCELAGSQQSRFVFLFDTFQDVAKTETEIWIIDHILRMATPTRVNCIVIVLAGKQVPEPTAEWAPYCKVLTLQPLKLVDWLEYATSVKSNLTRDQIEQCYERHWDKPLTMAQIIDTFVKRGAV